MIEKNESHSYNSLHALAKMMTYVRPMLLNRGHRPLKDRLIEIQDQCY